jgi:isopenicillin N synthase-like dioxygenase
MIGATPECVEMPKEQQEVINKYSKENTPQTPQPPPFDAKWRYIYNIADLIEDIDQNRLPADFPEFEEIVEAWGKHMLNGCNIVAEMAAIGLGLERSTFSDMIKRGPYKLAPTGSDLKRYKVGTVLAGFHYDFNFLTIHGKSRYPGLFAWLRTGEKFSVAVPEGHLLLQAGKQFEWVTGGHISCGYHEVIYTP